MRTVLLLFILFFVFGTTPILYAQGKREVVLKLKNGYSVKGEIIEQTPEVIRIKTLSGETFEYRIDEIDNIPATKVSREIEEIPLCVAKGDKLINLGVGILKTKTGKMTIPSIPVNFEYIVFDDLMNNKLALGVGGYIGYTALSDWTYYYIDGNLVTSKKKSYLLFGARGYAHYALVPKLDTYGGIFLGYENLFLKEEDEGNYKASLFVGGRYFFNDKIAGMAELGWGLSVLTLGVTVKL